MGTNNSNLHVVVGGQFGSEAKGHVAGYLAKRTRKTGRKTVGVRVAGPNAGHTAYDDNGKAWALRTIPVPAVTNPNAVLIIAPGSEIDPDVLHSELQALEQAGIKAARRLIIDGSATILTPDHHMQEGASALKANVGSTTKGIGACRADRIWRTAKTIWQAREQVQEFLGDEVTITPPGETSKQVLYTLQDEEQPAEVIIEGTQGYGLGLHTENYPQVTSSDTRAIDFLAMAGISPWALKPEQLKVWVVFRPYPIRVAGNSGPLAGETTWEELGLPEEYTTVTKKVRRVGTWDPELALEAIKANGGHTCADYQAVQIAFAMADQVVPEIAGGDGHEILDNPKLVNWINMLEASGAPVGLVLTGPNTEVDVYEQVGY